MPEKRLSDEQINELLARAADDSVHPADVFDVARFSGATDEDSYIDQAVHLVTELLRLGLVLAGDLTDAGFRPWPGRPLESAERIAVQWRTDPDAAPVSFFVWLEATPRGIERRQESLTSPG